VGADAASRERDSLLLG